MEEDIKVPTLYILHMPLLRQLLIIHPRHLHVNINAIQQWPTNSLLVAGNR